MNNIYIPMTLTEMIDGLQGIIRTSDGQLTGEEYVVGATYISSPNNPEVPPGSLALFLKRGTLKSDEFETGTIVLTPAKLNKLM